MPIDDSTYEVSVGAVFFSFCCFTCTCSVLTIPNYHEIRPSVTETWPLKSMPTVQVSQFLSVKLVLLKIYQKGEGHN